MKITKFPQKWGSLSWGIFFLLVLLLIAGGLNQASVALEGTFFKKQLLWFALGSINFSILAFLDYRKIITPRLMGVIYLFLILLLLVGVFEHTRWIHIAGLSLQPSEFAKLILISMLSLVLSQQKILDYLDRKSFITMTAIAFPLIMLVAIEDLDQGFMLFLIYASFILVAGIPKKWIAILCLLGLLGGAIGGHTFWSMLKPYQRDRVKAFFKPEKFKMDRGYQTLQALIAVGSGGIKGLGFKEGLSSRLNYLPEKHTDLAFAVWAEEWGFIGASLVLIICALLIILLLRLAFQVRDPLGQRLCFGAAAMFFWEVTINAGGILHLLPVASVPFPFLSYGGSAVLVNMAMLGLAFGVSRRRYSFR